MGKSLQLLCVMNVFWMGIGIALMHALLDPQHEQQSCHSMMACQVMMHEGSAQDFECMARADISLLPKCCRVQHPEG